MPRYKMVVYSRPAPDREDEYNDWYQNVHLGELVALPGFKSARRFRHARNLVDGDAYPYMSIYEIETDDIDAVLDTLRDTAGRGALTMSESIDLTDTSALVYEEFGPSVSAASNLAVFPNTSNAEIRSSSPSAVLESPFMIMDIQLSGPQSSLSEYERSLSSKIMHWLYE